MRIGKIKYFFLGMVVLLLMLVLGVLTFLFSDFLVKYSGITTFYSLLAIFLIFTITEYFKKKEELNEHINTLRSIFRVSRTIERDLTYYVDNLGVGRIPPTTMGEFAIEEEGLPLEIKSISTRPLYELIIFSNSKIETINEWKTGISEILFEPNQKERDKLLKRFNEVWGDSADVAIKDLRQSLDDIRSELSKWIKVDF